MATVRINNKTYTVPELTFRDSKLMEQMGLPLEGAVSKQYLLTAISAFTAIVARVEPEQADNFIEQHLLGGGNLEDIYKAYAQAMGESRFFKSLLGAGEMEKQSKETKMLEERVGEGQ